MTRDPAMLARRWFEEIWNQRRLETIDEIMDPHAHGVLEDREVRSPDDFKAACSALLHAFPDLRVTVEDVISQGEQVVVRWSAAGTHSGPGASLDPSGRVVTFRGLTWMIFRDGKLVQGWDAWNQAKLIRDLQAR